MTLDPNSLWQALARAVACRIEFEHCCARGALVDESSVVRFAAEYLQAIWDGPIRANEPHKGIAGKFIDLVGTQPRSGCLDLALEAKWAKTGGGAREWLVEVIRDLFRLQHFTHNLAQGCSRVLLVAGHKSTLTNELLERKVQSTNGGLVLALDKLLPIDLNAPPTKFQIKSADIQLHKWLSKCHVSLGAALPSTYDACLSGHYETKDDASGIAVYVWTTFRPKGWGSFDPVKLWK